MAMRVPEQFRVRSGKMGSDETFGHNGMFVIPPDYNNRHMVVVASDQEGWEHVSAHVRISNFSYTPTWEEMCLVKALFWDREDTVMQLHPPQSEWVNCHPNVLHLWRPALTEDEARFHAALQAKAGPLALPIPKPPAELVGPQKPFIKAEGGS